MATRTQESTADLAQMLLQWEEPLPPCAARSPLFGPCRIQPVALVVFKCRPCGPRRRPTCRRHLEMLVNRGAIVCDRCGGHDYEIVDVSRQ